MSTAAATPVGSVGTNTALFPDAATLGVSCLREQEDAFLLLDFVAVLAVDVLWVREFGVLARVVRGRGVRRPRPALVERAWLAFPLYCKLLAVSPI
jgi:hypothetical protein